MTPIEIQILVHKYEWVFMVVAFWDLGWKAFAMWHAAREGKKWWFIALAVCNTVGIFPIVYLLVTKKPWKNGWGEHEAMIVPQPIVPVPNETKKDEQSAA